MIQACDSDTSSERVYSFEEGSCSSRIVTTTIYTDGQTEKARETVDGMTRSETAATCCAESADSADDPLIEACDQSDPLI